MTRIVLNTAGRALVLVGAFIGMIKPAHAVEKLGFKLDNATIPVADIRAGGPPRDGIPSIDRPKFVPASRVRFLAPDDMVVSFTHGGETRAYPLRILVWHEIVNDEIGNLAINVSYCPLCGSASRRFTITDAEGHPMPFTPAYWFAWQAFHPETSVWSAQQ